MLTELFGDPKKWSDELLCEVGDLHRYDSSSGCFYTILEQVEAMRLGYV